MYSGGISTQPVNSGSTMPVTPTGTPAGSTTGQTQNTSQSGHTYGTSSTNSAQQSTGTTDQASATNSAYNGNANEQNVYSQGQQNLQGTAEQTLQQVLATGQLPAGFTNNSAAIQAADANFTNNEAPTLAAQFGAGSPVIGSSFAQMNQQLQGQLSQEDYSNFNNTLGEVQSFAFNPLGTNSQTSGTNNSQTITQQANTQNTNSQANSSSANSSNALGALAGNVFTAANGIFGN
jgi:hypothetical protein